MSQCFMYTKNSIQKNHRRAMLTSESRWWRAAGGLLGRGGASVGTRLTVMGDHQSNLGYCCYSDSQASDVTNIPKSLIVTLLIE